MHTFIQRYIYIYIYIYVCICMYIHPTKSPNQPLSPHAILPTFCDSALQAL